MSQVDDRTVGDGLGRLSGATPGERYGYARTRRDLRCAHASPVALHETGWDTPLFPMSNRSAAARNLAAAFLAGAWSRDALLRRGAEACGWRGPGCASWSVRLLAVPGGALRDPEALTCWIENQRAFQEGWSEPVRLQQSPLRRLFQVVPRMAPAAGPPTAWPIPPLPTVAALADWLGLGDRELSWFADCRGREADAPPGPLRHYTYHRVQKMTGRLPRPGSAEAAAEGCPAPHPPRHPRPLSAARRRPRLPARPFARRLRRPARRPRARPPPRPARLFPVAAPLARPRPVPDGRLSAARCRGC